jgi:ABC-type polysaccharide/polyol phosphate export permease
MLGSELKNAITDICQGFKKWQIWYSLGITPIRQRYRRSALGQFWLTLTTAINIFALGFVWSFLFKVGTKDYLQYIAIGSIIWAFITALINESCNIFVAGDNYLKQVALPKSVFAYANVAKNIFIFLHNLLIVPFIFIIFGSINNSITLEGIILSFIGLIIIIINGVWVSLLLGILGTRFRDLQSIVPSITQIAFYITPIVWKIEYMPEHIRWWIELNPFYIFLSLAREPILGITCPTHFWYSAIAITVLGSLISFLFFIKYRKRIVYWL